MKYLKAAFETLKTAVIWTLIGIAAVLAVVLVVGVVATFVGCAMAYLLLRLAAPVAFRAALVWFAWTYLELGLLFTSLPSQLQTLNFASIFALLLIVQVAVMTIRSGAGMKSLPPFPKGKGRKLGEIFKSLKTDISAGKRAVPA